MIEGFFCVSDFPFQNFVGQQSYFFGCPYVIRVLGGFQNNLTEDWCSTTCICWPHSSRQVDEEILQRKVLRLRNSALDFLEVNLQSRLFNIISVSKIISAPVFFSGGGGRGIDVFPPFDHLSHFNFGVPPSPPPTWVPSTFLVQRSPSHLEFLHFQQQSCSPHFFYLRRLYNCYNTALWFL